MIRDIGLFRRLGKAHKQIVQKLSGIIGLRVLLSEPMSESSHKQKRRIQHEHERLLVGTRCWNHLHLPTRSVGVLRREQGDRAAQGHIPRNCRRLYTWCSPGGSNFLHERDCGTDAEARPCLRLGALEGGRRSPSTRPICTRNGEAHSSTTKWNSIPADQKLANK